MARLTLEAILLSLLLLLLSTVDGRVPGTSHAHDAVENLIVEHVRRVLLGNSSEPTTSHDRNDGDARMLGNARIGRRRRRHGFAQVAAATMLRGSTPTPTAANQALNLPSFPGAPPPPPPLPPAPKFSLPQQTGCAWSVTVTAATYNVAFPDLNCVYQVLLYWGLEGKTALRIEGQFPRVRYFSFQSYDVASGQPLASVVDYEIEPHAGFNPFQEPPYGDADRPAGIYRVHLTDTGDHGFTNELAATSAGARPTRRRCRGKECLTLVIMRLYTAEPGQDAFHHEGRSSSGGGGGGVDDHLREWGYVAPPEVTVRYGTHVNKRTGRVTSRHKTLTPCDPRKSTLAKSFLDWKVPQLQRDWEGEGALLDNEDDNFIVYTPSSSSRALFANADANYLFATAKNNRVHEGKQLVARITGHLPTVARGFATYPRIADRDVYEARYVSLSTIALKGAGPVIDTVMDATIEQRQLAGRPGRGLVPDDEDFEYGGHHRRPRHDMHHHHHKEKARAHANPDPRGFSVVAAPTPEFLEGCPPQVYQVGRDLFLTTVERGARSPPSHLAFLYRQILSQWQTSGRRDRSIARAKAECLGRREQGLCHLRSFFIDLMGPQYPRIKYYYCWRNVTHGCSCEDAKGELVPWAAAGDEHGDEHDDEAGWWDGEADDLVHGRKRPHARPWDDEDEREWDEWWSRSTTEMRGAEPVNGTSSIEQQAMSTTQNETSSLNTTLPLNNDTSSTNAFAMSDSTTTIKNNTMLTVHVNDSALADCQHPEEGRPCRGRPIIVSLHRGRLVHDGIPKQSLTSDPETNLTRAAAVDESAAVVTKDVSTGSDYIES